MLSLALLLRCADCSSESAGGGEATRLFLLITLSVSGEIVVRPDTHMLCVFTSQGGGVQDSADTLAAEERGADVLRQAVPRPAAHRQVRHRRG